MHEGDDVVVLVLPHGAEGVPAEVEPERVNAAQAAGAVLLLRRPAARGADAVLALHEVRALLVVEAEDEEVVLVVGGRSGGREKCVMRFARTSHFLPGSFTTCSQVKQFWPPS